MLRGRWRNGWKFVIALGAAAVLASCGGADEADSSEPELLDAAEVNREREEANSTSVEYGEAAEYEGVSVTILGAPRWTGSFTSGDSEYGTVLMDVLFENRSDEDVDMPLITVHCESDEGMYSNQHSGPIDGDVLPGGTKAEGETETSPTLPCDDGWVQWNPDDLGDDAPAFRWVLPPP